MGKGLGWAGLGWAAILSGFINKECKIVNESAQNLIFFFTVFSF
jgi:hypothetical protein